MMQPAMRGRLDEFRRPREGEAEPAIWITVALSLLIHVAVLLGLPGIRLPSLEPPDLRDASRSLSVNLAPRPSPPPATPSPSAPGAQPLPMPAKRPPAATRRRPAPPVIALKPPAPAIPAPARSSDGGDLSSYIEEKRRARSAAAPAASVPEAPRAEPDDRRRDRIAGANLAMPREPGFAHGSRVRRGTFQLQRVGADDAEFIFYGWDKANHRNTAQLIEVERGANSDIRIAVVRRIIAIIREHEQGDFLWESSRLGRRMALSAHTRDNARLEGFMMHEFFGGPFPAR